jgi:hypothetical protein
MSVITHQTCRTCLRRGRTAEEALQPLANFPVDRARLNGRSPRCKTCAKEAANEQHARIRSGEHRPASRPLGTVASRDRILNVRVSAGEAAVLDAYCKKTRQRPSTVLMRGVSALINSLIKEEVCP